MLARRKVGVNLTIQSSSLKCLLTNALLFAPTKGNLAVVRFRSEPGSFSAVATDGYVLSVEGAEPVESTCVIAETSVTVADAKALRDALPKEDQPVSVMAGPLGGADIIQFSTDFTQVRYSAAPHEFPPWAQWLENARAAAGRSATVGLAPQFLAKIGRADPYGGQGKPADWAGVATVELQCTTEGAAAMWSYGEHLHGLVKPLTNVTLSGEELAAATSRRKKAAVPKCPVCKTAELTAGRERCQSCVAVEIINGGK